MPDQKHAGSAQREAVCEVQPAMNRQDLEREQRIDLCYFDLVAAQTPEERRAAFERLKVESKQRRPERVEEMERERGLR